MRHQALALAALLSVAFCSVGPALAQPPAETPEDRAAGLAQDGRQSYQEGRWLDAHGKFEQAQKLVRSPVFELYMARSLRNVSRLLEAKGHYESIIANALPDSAPNAWREAQADAKRELPAVTERIPKLVLILKPGGPGVHATLDGRTIETDRPTPTDPGQRRIAVLRAGQEVAARDVMVEEGKGQIDVVIEVPASAQPPPVVETAVDGPLAPGAVVLSVGLAALIVSGVTGGLALSEKGQLDDLCPGGACPESERDRLDRANTLATVSTAMIIAGGVLSAGGVTLLILRPGGSSGPAQAAVVSVRPSWTSLTVRGFF